MPEPKRGDERKAGKALPDRQTRNNPGRTPGKAEGSEEDVKTALRRQEKRSSS